MLKEPIVIDLVKRDFNLASNRQLVAAALDQKIAFRYYFEGTVIDTPVLCRYPDSDRPAAYFPTIDFRKPRFIHAIEDYVIDTSRAIVLQAARGDAMTAICQIFGEGAMDLIETGRLPMIDPYPADNNNRKTYDPARWMTAPGAAPSTIFTGLRLVKS